MREGKGLPMPVKSLQQLRHSDHDFRREEGSVFEAAAVSFLSLVQELEGRIATEVLTKAKATCKKYRGERSVYLLCLSLQS